MCVDKMSSVGYFAVVVVLLVIAGILALLGVSSIAGFPVLSAGNFAFGYLAAGQFSVGVFASGTFAVGIFAAGIFAIGIFSIGIFSVGIFSIGLFALGIFVQRVVVAQGEKSSSQPEKTSQETARALEKLSART